MLCKYLPFFWAKDEDTYVNATKKFILSNLEEWLTHAREDVEEGDGDMYGIKDWMDKTHNERWMDILDVDVLLAADTTLCETEQNIAVVTKFRSLPNLSSTAN